MKELEEMIRESSLPKNSLSYQIMHRIGEREMTMTRTSSKRPNGLKRTILVASAAAVLGGTVIGSGFVSPVMAATLKQIPVLGVLFEGTSEDAVKAAIEQGILSEPNLSVTHDGVTLKVADLLYDGTRLSFILEREGVDLPSTASPYIGEDETIVGNPDNEYIKSRKVAKEDQVKGYIERPRILVDGRDVEFGEGGFGDYPPQNNAYMVELTKDLKLPDQFELTIQANVTQVNETFEFKIPVNIANKSIVVKPDQATKSDGQFSYTVKQLYISPVSTRLVLDSEGEVPASAEQTGNYSASMVYYELVDDQGNVLTPQKFDYFHSKPKTEYHIDQLFSPVNGTPKSITIKPFTLTVNNKDWSVVGHGKNSHGDKTYLTDLEMTIPVKP
ncbi:Tat pathway signal protein [Paenibacillus ihbetae]|uniref:Tat pathway signal protein n=2 Tax=Paenibacillus ihbetae TaxID=1870820 RepID=A0ABX3JSR8_9BACL|nr:Tat pathway signal protein [Paenibacillus ihbetae]